MADGLTAEQVVGQRIKSLRTLHGWSQQELATRMEGMGHTWRQTTVTKTENADRPIRVNEAVHLSQIFGVTIGELLPGVGHPDLNAPIGAARRRVRECERAKTRIDDELAEARREVDRLALQMRGAGVEADNG
jgi:transcriptional regulator with XRE-family HTH domain